jgi:ribosome-associated protein
MFTKIAERIWAGINGPTHGDGPPLDGHMVTSSAVPITPWHLGDPTAEHVRSPVVRCGQPEYIRPVRKTKRRPSEPGRRSDVAATDHARRLALTAANAAASKKAHNITLLDVSDQLVITDCFVIASAPNERQVQAIVDAVEEKMAAAGTKPVRREGAREGRWVLLDFVDVVVHVQHAEERSFYGLERLWKDCPTIPFVADAAEVDESV